jgi:excinuclease ABC subunit C
MRTIVRILEGKTDLVFRSLRKEIRDLTKTEQYENALKLRDALRQLELLIMLGSFVDGNIHSFNRSEQALTALQTILKPYYPNVATLHRIECYDNSTLSFQHSTASMIVFTDGMVDKKEYRRFKMKTQPNNDFDMMKEILERRSKNTRWDKPDLIVIDGGKPQVKVVLEVLNSKFRVPNQNQSTRGTRNSELGTVPIIGLAKNPDRIVVGVDGLPTIRPQRHNLGYRLLQHMRDEAHRFAKKYHTYLRNHNKMVQ